MFACRTGADLSPRISFRYTPHVVYRNGLVPNFGLSTIAPSRSRSNSSDQNCIIATRSSQYSPRV